MTTETSHPYDWIETVNSALVAHDDTPLLGKVPHFPWDDFAKVLEDTFELEELTITHSDWSWLTAEKMGKNLGSPLKTLTFNVTPFEGAATCLIAIDHVDTIISWLLKQPATSLEDEDRETFLRFLLMETLHQYQHIYPQKGLTPVLASTSEPLNEEGLAIDLTVGQNKQQVALRFVLSPSLRKAWQEHHKEGPSSETSQKVAEKTTVTLSGQAGTATLPLNEWKKLNTGDLLLLDNCSVIPPKRGAKAEGQLLLSLNDKPLFVTQLEDDKLKIIGYPTARQS